MKYTDDLVILLVEDHETMRHALRDTLPDEFAGCLVMAAESGEEAVYMAREDHPDVVIMDFDLPDMSGIEATEIIKILLPDAIVIMCSLSDDEADRNAAYAAGANEWVSKDHATESLISAILRQLMLRSCEDQDSDDMREGFPELFLYDDDEMNDSEPAYLLTSSSEGLMAEGF